MGDVSERKMLVFSFGASSVAVADEAELGSSVAAVEDSAVTSGSGTGVVSVEGMRWTLCKASLSWKSVNWLNGSRFERIVPEKRTGS